MNPEFDTLKTQSIEFFNNKEYPKAIEGFQACMRLCIEAGDELSLAEMKNNLSVVLLKTKDAQGAFDVVQGTDEIFLSHGDQNKQAMALANTATALEALGKKEEALQLYEKASDVFKEIGEKEMRKDILKRISDLQLKTNRGLQAIASMEAAYDQNDKKNLKDSVFKKLIVFLKSKLIK